MNKRNLIFKTIALMVAVMLIGAGSAFAADQTWVGLTNGNWSTIANWTSAVPVSGDKATFPNLDYDNVTVYTPIVDVPAQVDGIVN